jgi:hypothetical protein
MKKSYLKYLLSLAYLAPSFAFAQAPQDTQQALTSVKGLFGPSGSFLQFNTAGQLFTFIIRTMLAFAGVVAIIYIIYGGYIMITSSGDPNKYKKGRSTVGYAAIGIAVVVLAYVIVNAVVNIASTGF